MATTNISGTPEHLRTLINELEEKGIEVKDSTWATDVNHLTLWDISVPGETEVVAYYHGATECKLNANLPSHRKHFIDKCIEILPKSSFVVG